MRKIILKFMKPENEIIGKIYQEFEDPRYRLERIISSIPQNKDQKSQIQIFMEFLYDETGRESWNQDWDEVLD